MNIARQLHAALIAVMALAAFAPRIVPAAEAGAGTLSDADRQCLTCHGEAGLTKTFEKGETLPLHVEAAAFAKSVHAAVGCVACHADVDLQKHPAEAAAFPDARAFSVAMSQACRSCHEASFDAHAASVHGKAQGKEGLAAPLCVNCHGTHDIARASTGNALREACLGCHADAPSAHARWLPNAKLHFEVVACAACHAPNAGKRVELRFYDLATKQELVSDGRPFAPSNRALADASHAIDATALRDVVRAMDRGGAGGNVVLVGRVEPNAGGEGHRILPKAQAVKDCATCHRKGADPFQNVSLSVVGPDGERVLYQAQKDVLHSPTSVESVRAFYAIGGTRIQLLDVVLALALVGGICAPLGHMLVRRIMRRKDESHE